MCTQVYFCAANRLNLRAWPGARKKVLAAVKQHYAGAIETECNNCTAPALLSKISADRSSQSTVWPEP